MNTPLKHFRFFRHLILLLLTALATQSSSVRADPREMISENCKGYRAENRRWVAESQLPIPKGSQVDASPVAGRTDQVTLKWEGVYYAVPVRCLKEGGSVTAVAPASGGVLPSAKNVSAFARGKQPALEKKSFFRIETGLLSWQETATLQSPDSRSVALRSSNFGALLGFGYQRVLSRHFELHGLASVVYGSSELGNSTESAGSDLQYLVSGVTTLGGLAEASFLWMPTDPDVALGVGVPVLVRSADWAEPSGYTLNSRFAMAPGAFLEGRMTRGHWVIFSRFGMLSGIGNVAWNLSAAYQW